MCGVVIKTMRQERHNKNTMLHKWCNQRAGRKEYDQCTTSGIDWADKSHQICLQTEDGQIISELEIKHNWKGFEELQTLLETVQPVEINLERGDGLLVDWLVGQG